MELNKIYNCDCLEGLQKLEANSVDLTVTSPPYDNLRTYTDKNSGDCEWNFEVFKPIADELFRVTKKGGIVVWVIGDACIDGEETGSSFKQALYFQKIGFKLHDTMIYEKNSSSFPAKLSSKRYTQIFEYMFVFSKGKIRNDITLIADKRNKWAGWTNWGQHSQYDKEGNLVQTNNIKPIAEFSLRTNIWRYPVSFNDKTNHPAVFPEKLAEDHILSWSLEGDTVLDPFMGSGTTAKMAMLNHRNYIGFERNSEYYQESLKRVEKYAGKENTLAYNISAPDIKDYEKMTTSDELWENLQVNPTVDKDDDKKAQLWKELTKELEDYFNTQSYGILKNLKVNLSFASKSNDKRVNNLNIQTVSIPTVTIINEKTEEEKCESQCGTLFTEAEMSNGSYQTITDKVNTLTIKDNFEECCENCECDENLFPEFNPLTEKLFDQAIKEYNLQHKSNDEEVIFFNKNFELMVDEYISKSFKNMVEEYVSQTLEKLTKDNSFTTNTIEKAEDFCSSIVLPEVKHRGRPKGSKNKAKKNEVTNE